MAVIFIRYPSRACLKNHSHNLYASLCGIFCPNSVVVARTTTPSSKQNLPQIVMHILQKAFFKQALTDCNYFLQRLFYYRILFFRNRKFPSSCYSHFKSADRMDMRRVYHVTLVALQKQVPIAFFQNFQAFELFALVAVIIGT